MRRPSSVRLAASAAAASAVLLLGACSSDSDSGGDSEDTGGEDQQSQESSGGGDSGSSGSGGGEDGGSVGELEGTWITGVESPYNILLFSGDSASFMDDSGEEVCSGLAAAGELSLICQSGDTSAGTYTMEGDSLTVVWEEGSQEAYQRLDDAAMDQLPSPPPTDMQDIPGIEDLQDLDLIEGASS
jgi:hypothetical protein